LKKVKIILGDYSHFMSIQIPGYHKYHQRIPGRPRNKPVNQPGAPSLPIKPTAARVRRLDSP